MRELLRDARDVVAASNRARVDVERRPHDAEVAAVAVEEHRRREQRRTRAQRERRRPGGQRRALTEELDLDAAAADVAVAQEAERLPFDFTRLDRR